MPRDGRKVFISLILLIVCFASVASAQYPIIAVRSERLGDAQSVGYPDVFLPTQHPTSDLVLINPDGTEEVLVSGNDIDAVFDPKTIDGVNVYFVRIKDCKQVHTQRRNLPFNGSDIYSINVETRVETKWTDQTQAPLEGFADWNTTPFNYGVLNLGPQPLPDGRLVYVSSRRRIAATKAYTTVCMQLHVRHTDGRVECIAPMSQGSALHPELLRDGRIAFSSYESMGLRDIRLWSLWQIHPDGTNWGPLISSYESNAFHFHTQRTSGEVVTTAYYNANNNGFGSLLGFDEFPTYTAPEIPVYVQAGYHYNKVIRWDKIIFAPTGIRSLTPWTHSRDQAAASKAWIPVGSPVKGDTVPGAYLGKVSHPSAAPGNALLVTYTGGPANKLNRPESIPVEHCEIRIIKSDTADAGPDGMELIIKKDGFNYTQPRALVAFSEIYGTDAIALPSKVDHTKSYGIFGSSDGFFGQWKFGLDSGSTGQPESLVFLGTEPNIAVTYGHDLRGRQFSSGTTGWTNGINERLRILGEYAMDEPDRPGGDNSFRVKLPADVPFTVAIRGDDGRFLTCGQSWKQVRPGYQEINCMGCHNHAGEAVSNLGKYAWEDDYILPDFTGQWRTPEFHKDVKPILDENCMSCHDGSNATAKPLSVANVLTMCKPLQAGKSPLSHRLRGEHGLAQMPLNAQPLSDAAIMTIDEWIDCGCLVDEGQGAAFDVFDQIANPNPIAEAIPTTTVPIEPPECESIQLHARIQVLESQIQRIKAITEEPE